MGIDYVLFDRLVDLSTRFRPEGRTLMLGRQGFSIQSRYRKLYNDTLERHGIEASRFDFLQEDGFAETLMRKLGFGGMEAIVLRRGHAPARPEPASAQGAGKAVRSDR